MVTCGTTAGVETLPAVWAFIDALSTRSSQIGTLMTSQRTEHTVSFSTSGPVQDARVQEAARAAFGVADVPVSEALSARAGWGLAEAVSRGDEERAAELLAAGADPDGRLRSSDRSALQWAAAHGLDDTARALVENGADVSLEASSGQTPLHVAAKSGSIGVARILLAAGADPGGRNELGDRPLHVACRGRHREMVALLLDSGADVGARDRSGATPLHYAASYGERGLAELLVDRGADPRARSGRGATPVGAAFRAGHEDLARWLKAVSTGDADP